MIINITVTSLRNVDQITLIVTMDSSGRSKCSLLPQRVVLGIMGFLGIVVSFLMRASLSIAITEMVIPIKSTEAAHDSLICPAVSTPVQSTNITHEIGTKYDWSQEQQGWVLSAFFVGYIISHIPGGMLAQRFGGKWTLSLGILIITVCNAVTPQALEKGGDNALILLIVLRMLMGLAAGPSFPALTVLLAAWVPQKERGKLGTLVLGGGPIGSLLSIYLSGIILSYWPWPVVFYVWSFIALIWFIAFTILCSNDPASHPFITKEEREYLKFEMGQLKRNTDLPPTPWTAILTSLPIIILLISQIGNDWLFYVLASDLPKYMKEVLGFSVREVGLYSSLPYLPMWIISIFSGFVCDYLISHQFISVINARKLFTALSGIFPALFVVAASYAGCNKLLVVAFFVFAMGFMGNYYPGMRVNALDLSPNYAGSIIALTNGAGSISGVVVPTFIGYMTPDSTLDQWRFVFWITFVISIVRTIIYLIWASADVQPWNDPKDRKLRESDRLTSDIEKS